MIRTRLEYAKGHEDVRKHSEDSYKNGASYKGLYLWRERLKEMGLPTLKDRREWDLIMLYKIINTWKR